MLERRAILGALNRLFLNHFHHSQTPLEVLCLLDVASRRIEVKLRRSHIM